VRKEALRVVVKMVLYDFSFPTNDSQMKFSAILPVVVYGGKKRGIIIG